MCFFIVLFEFVAGFWTNPPSNALELLLSLLASHFAHANRIKPNYMETPTSFLIININIYHIQVFFVGPEKEDQYGHFPRHPTVLSGTSS